MISKRPISGTLDVDKRDTARRNRSISGTYKQDVPLMMKPLCKICGHRHYSSEPPIWADDAPAAVISVPLKAGPTRPIERPWMPPAVIRASEIVAPVVARVAAPETRQAAPKPAPTAKPATERKRAPKGSLTPEQKRDQERARKARLRAAKLKAPD